METRINRVLIDGENALDLSEDTVDAAHLARGYTAHDRDGTPVVGAMEGGGYSVLQTASYSGSTLTVTLPSKPKIVVVALRGGTIAANGMFGYASLDPVSGEYVSRIQTRASGSAVAWSDVDRYAVWDERTKTFSMRVRAGTGASGTCTYHAVG